MKNNCSNTWLFLLTIALVFFALVFVGHGLNLLWGDESFPYSLTLYTLSGLPLAVSFYRLRRRHRLFYGVFELIAACALFYATIVNIIRGFLATQSETILFRMMTFTALLYFMVRALDNIGEGIQPGSKFDRWWNWLFPKLKQRKRIE